MESQLNVFSSHSLSHLDLPPNNEKLNQLQKFFSYFVNHSTQLKLMSSRESERYIQNRVSYFLDCTSVGIQVQDTYSLCRSRIEESSTEEVLRNLKYTSTLPLSSVISYTYTSIKEGITAYINYKIQRQFNSDELNSIISFLYSIEDANYSKSKFNPSLLFSKRAFVVKPTFKCEPENENLLRLDEFIDAICIGITEEWYKHKNLDISED